MAMETRCRQLADEVAAKDAAQQAEQEQQAMAEALLKANGGVCGDDVGRFGGCT